MKVLNVVTVYFVVPFFFTDQFAYFKKRGVESHVSCSPDKRLAPWAHDHNFTPHEILLKRNISPIQDVKTARELIRLMRKGQFDIVCGHTPKGGLLSMIAARWVGVKRRIYFRHGLVYETCKGLKRQLLMATERIASWLATDVVCVSPYLVERSVKDHLTKKAKMHVLNMGSCNGIDAIGKFNPEHIDQIIVTQLREKYGLQISDRVVGYTGRLVKDKGLVELVEAFETLSKQYDDLKLLLVGPLEERDGLPDHIVDVIEKHPKIVYTGLVDDNIECYYYMMNYLVLCTHREGLGTSILEASSMGVPVLTTSHTGSRDAIVENVTGVYVETNANSLGTALKQYIDDPMLAKQHGKAGREHMLQNFQQEIVWNEILKLYNA